MTPGTRGDRGQATINYVLIFPVVLIFITLVVQAAYWYLARQAALSAAAEGVRAARAYTAPAAAGRQAAREFAEQTGSAFLKSPTITAVGDSKSVEIRVAGHAPSIFPGLDLRVDQVARAPKERWVPAGDDR